MRKYWYPIAYSRDVTTKEPYGISLLGDPLVLWRDGNGTIQCFSDLCPHRSASLAGGFIINGQLECKYHGWQFKGDGECVHIPSYEKKPSKSNCAIIYPVKERWNLIWVWPIPGDEENALPEKIPDFLFVPQAAGWASIQHLRDLDIDHGLIIENVLDPAHVPFTHDGTLSKRSEAEPIWCKITFDNIEKTPTTKFPTYLPENFSLVEGRFSANSGKGTTAAFIPPCTVRFTPYFGKNTMIQVHISVPIAKNRCRVFSNIWVDVPYIDYFPSWIQIQFSQKILDQDVELLLGQSRNLGAGANPWKSAVSADKLGVRYRRWRDQQENKGGNWFNGFQKLADIEDLMKQPKEEKDVKEVVKVVELIDVGGGKDFHPKKVVSWMWAPSRSQMAVGIIPLLLLLWFFFGI